MPKVVGFIAMNSRKSVDSQRAKITAWAEANRYQMRTFRGSFVSALCAANRGDVLVMCCASSKENRGAAKLKKVSISEILDD